MGRFKREMTPAGRIMALAEGDANVTRILEEFLAEYNTMMFVLVIEALDGKELYGARIYTLFHDVCGDDPNRFAYHVLYELPHQKTGKLRVTSGFNTKAELQAHEGKRRFGRPGTFWALQTPPTSSHYEFPIQ